MEELNKILWDILKQQVTEKETADDIIKQIDKEESIYLFRRENHLMAYLLGKGYLTYERYEELCKNFEDRNKYMYLYDFGPRKFGTTWAEEHVRKLAPDIKKTTKKNLNKIYPNFDGEFDLWLSSKAPNRIVRIEVKACRAAREKTGDSESGSLTRRAFSHNEAKKAKFQYHFQQIKLSCCDVFIWIGVCRDKILYWVLSKDEMEETIKISSQHRNENTKTGAEVYEGQVFVTEEDLEKFRVDEKDILKIVREKGNK